MNILPNALNPTGKTEVDPQQKAAARQEMLVEKERLERLLGNEDFQWFLGFIRKGEDFCEDQSSEIERNDSQKRDAYGLKRAALREMRKWPQRQLDALNDRLKE